MVSTVTARNGFSHVHGGLTLLSSRASPSFTAVFTNEMLSVVPP